MTEFDTARDNHILNIFKENKHDMFSVAPVMGYYLAKMNEIKVIRVVLVCIKNKVPQKEINKRLRLMYA
jgi:V/A-type H+-transporting ATPase subunit C